MSICTDPTLAMHKLSLQTLLEHTIASTKAVVLTITGIFGGPEGNISTALVMLLQPIVYITHPHISITTCSPKKDVLVQAQLNTQHCSLAGVAHNLALLGII